MISPWVVDVAAGSDDDRVLGSVFPIQKSMLESRAARAAR
jgi:hypothetical protein